MHVYDNHYFAIHLQCTWSLLVTPVERLSFVNCYQNFANRKISSLQAKAIVYMNRFVFLI